MCVCRRRRSHYALLVSFSHLGYARERVIWNALLLTNYCLKCMKLVQIVERDLCFASAFRWYSLPFVEFLCFSTSLVFFRLFLFHYKMQHYCILVTWTNAIPPWILLYGNRISSSKNVHIITVQRQCINAHFFVVYRAHTCIVCIWCVFFVFCVCFFRMCVFYPIILILWW